MLFIDSGLPASDRSLPSTSTVQRAKTLERRCSFFSFMVSLLKVEYQKIRRWPKISYVHYVCPRNIGSTSSIIWSSAAPLYVASTDSHSTWELRQEIMIRSGWEDFELAARAGTDGTESYIYDQDVFHDAVAPDESVYSTDYL
jgi:hypothetical protein